MNYTSRGLDKNHEIRNYFIGAAMGALVMGAALSPALRNASHESDNSDNSDYIAVQTNQARVDFYPVSNISTMRVERNGADECNGADEWVLEADVYSVGSPGWKPVILCIGTYDECMKYMQTLMDAKGVILVE